MFNILKTEIEQFPASSGPYGTLGPGNYAYENFFIFQIQATILNFGGQQKCLISE